MSQVTKKKRDKDGKRAGVRIKKHPSKQQEINTEIKNTGKQPAMPQHRMTFVETDLNA